MSLIISSHSEQSAHWYSSKDGSPVHQVPTADGKSMRNTTVADARKRGDLLPSVTSILSVIAKPALVSWLQENAIMAALTLPRVADESLEEFAHRVILDSKETAGKAADLGTAVHAAIEEYLMTGHMIPQSPQVLELFLPAKKWLDENIEKVISTERRVLNLREGYAGTVDIVALMKTGSVSVIDTKTQGMKQQKEGWKANFYPEFPLQGEAYRRAIDPMPDDFISLLVNSKEPSPCQAKVWPKEEQDGYWMAFLAARELWCYSKNWRPTTPAQKLSVN